MASNPTFEVGLKTGWKVRGKFRAGGVHAGAIEYSFCKPKTEAWLGGSTAIPKPLAAEVEAAKEKIRAHFKGKKTKAAAVKTKAVKAAAASPMKAMKAMKTKAKK